MLQQVFKSSNEKVETESRTTDATVQEKNHTTASALDGPAHLVGPAEENTSSLAHIHPPPPAPTAVIGKECQTCQTGSQQLVSGSGIQVHSCTQEEMPQVYAAEISTETKVFSK